MLVGNPLGEGERVAVGNDDAQSGEAATALLIGHADGALVGRPGVAIARVEQIEDFAGVVQAEILVEITGVVAADLHLELTLEFGEGFVVRSRGRREVIRTFGTHFVEIGVHMRIPFVIEARADLRFLLRLPRPVAVQIEEIMVGASTGPWLVMLARIAVHIHGFSNGLMVPDRVTIASVRVHGRVDDHNGVFEPFLGFSVGGIGQLVQRKQRRFQAHRLVSVDVVAQPDDGDAVIDRGSIQQAHTTQVVLADLLQFIHVFLRRDEGHHQGTSLIGLSVHLQFHVLLHRSHVLHIGHGFVMVGEALTHLIAEEFGWRFQGLGREWRGEQKQKTDEQKSFHKKTIR